MNLDEKREGPLFALQTSTREVQIFGVERAPFLDYSAATGEVADEDIVRDREPWVSRTRSRAEIRKKGLDRVLFRR